MSRIKSLNLDEKYYYRVSNRAERFFHEIRGEEESFEGDKAEDPPKGGEVSGKADDSSRASEHVHATIHICERMASLASCGSDAANFQRTRGGHRGGRVKEGGYTQPPPSYPLSPRFALSSHHSLWEWQALRVWDERVLEATMLTIGGGGDMETAEENPDSETIGETEKDGEVGLANGPRWSAC